MLAITFHNDLTGRDGLGNYNVEVLVSSGEKGIFRSLWKGRVEGHRRAEGWLKLVEQWVQEYYDLLRHYNEEEHKKERKEKYGPTSTPD